MAEIIHNISNIFTAVGVLFTLYWVGCCMEKRK